jgi:hypothetical protein
MGKQQRQMQPSHLREHQQGKQWQVLQAEHAALVCRQLVESAK